MSSDLLPPSAKHFERASLDAVEFPAAIGDAVTVLHGVKYHRPLNQSVAPWLVQEYGLGPVSSYFDNYEDLIDIGRAWQKVRGTPAAIETALDWIGYDAISIEDQTVRRRRWHLYQIGMGEMPLPVEEVQRLYDAAYLADVSDAARSEFFRGYFGYDVRGLELSNKRWSDALWGDSSGVRIDGNPVKWSHGRTVTVSGVAEPGKTVELGIDVTSGTPVHWNDGYFWTTPGLTWFGFASAGLIKAGLLKTRETHIGFYAADNSPIGYARVLFPLAVVGVDNVAETADIEFSVRTRFGDGEAAIVAKAAMVFDLAHSGPDWLRWVNPADVTAGIVAGLTPFPHHFMRTSRDLIKFTLTI
jgi:hypothetical protein